MQGILPAIAGALALGALNTFGDFLWAQYVRTHRMAWGLVHGALLCLAIGLVIGLARREPLRGALLGAAVGLIAALSFYALAPLFGYAAMFPAWMALWVGFAFVDARGLRATKNGGALVRGLLAALASGLAFYAISGTWTRPAPGGPDYASHFACWTFAFLPGFLALFAKKAGAA